MRNPTWEEIWSDEKWMVYNWEFMPVKSRTYYKVRSAVRMAVWIPFFIGCFYIIVGAASVFA